MKLNEKYYEQKFDDCSKLLESKPDNIVSFKYRDISYHGDYIELLDRINEIKGIKITGIGHALNGEAYNISYKGEKLILVEHETGLELIGLIASIATIISLVLQVVSMINNKGNGPASRHHEYRETELRYFDNKGKVRIERISKRTIDKGYDYHKLDNEDIKQLLDKIDKLEKKTDSMNKKKK